MQELNKQELLNISGGFGKWAIMGIVGGITFIIGVIDGFVRPLRCN
jgi:lactobin A/cerein 7B family class IIb bacteriocin